MSQMPDNIVIILLQNYFFKTTYIVTGGFINTPKEVCK